MRTKTNILEIPETHEIGDFTPDYGNDLPEASEFDIPGLTEDERNLQYNEYVSRVLWEVCQKLSFETVKDWVEKVSKNQLLAEPFGEGEDI